MNTDKVNIKTVLLAGGAYASYTIGAGFATGQEVLQFFGSYGLPWGIFTVLISLLMTVYFTSSAYKTGQSQIFDTENACYTYYCGKYVAIIFDLFILLLVFGIMIGMFAGAGATLNQYFGIPNIYGAILMGILAGGTVIAGLRKVVEILGFLGLVIIVYVVCIGGFAIFTVPETLSDATANLSTYLADGTIKQAGLFGQNNFVLSALTYAGVCLIVSVPFLISLGKTTSNQKEALAGGIFSGIFFHLGILLVVIALLLNLDTIAGTQIPMLAAMNKMIPAISITFAFILFAGIYTTATGYLWLISGRFAPDKSTKSRIIVVGLVILGIVGGTKLPFDVIVNILYPFAGLFGIIFMLFMIVKDIRQSKAKKQANIQ